MSGVTGSCHELCYTHRGQEGILIDCGLFQGDEALNAELQNGGRPDKPQEQLLREHIPFPIDHIARTGSRSRAYRPCRSHTVFNRQRLWQPSLLH